ncbi:hypothetical protein BBR47_40470 [Brevibacillus brevis NBRC 100599]|uniref:Uncharacterized protein n=1 Tax=Brevibacillus brevis (strain 47 / JCM 6285 / NBRC 100599) TaxID=358681 RepID=C0ZGW5_BREBN|nr:hypothetical protein BBR47_40470 [Brevibacillus brevis NBRC 100599]
MDASTLVSLLIEVKKRCSLSTRDSVFLIFSAFDFSPDSTA